MSPKESPGMEYLRHMSPEDQEKRRRALSKDFVLYQCPQCWSGVWYPRMREPEFLPRSFPCGTPCFGTMVKQREPEFWEEK